MPKANGEKPARRAAHRQNRTRARAGLAEVAVAAEQPLQYGDGHMVDGQNLDQCECGM